MAVVEAAAATVEAVETAEAAAAAVVDAAAVAADSTPGVALVHTTSPRRYAYHDGDI